MVQEAAGGHCSGTGDSRDHSCDGQYSTEQLCRSAAIESRGGGQRRRVCYRGPHRAEQLLRCRDQTLQVCILRSTSSSSAGCVLLSAMRPR